MARMNPPMDTPDEMLLTRAVLPSLYKDAGKAEASDETARQDKRKQQIKEFQAQADKLSIFSVKEKVKRTSRAAEVALAKAKEVKAMQDMYWEMYQKMTGHSWSVERPLTPAEASKAKERIMRELGIQKRTYHRRLNEYLEQLEKGQKSST
jgi:hypothetical protein